MLTLARDLRAVSSRRRHHRHLARSVGQAPPIDRLNQSRRFDSSTGRWIIPDPTGFVAGDTNEYRYVGNSPTDGTDPTGLAGAKRGDSGLTKAQEQKLIDAVAGVAEWVYQTLEKYGPSDKTIELINGGIDDFFRPLQPLLVADPNYLKYDPRFGWVDRAWGETDINKWGWGQLLAAWIFEVGGTLDEKTGVYEFTFSADSKIAQDVLKLDAVQEAIKKARKAIRDLKDHDGLWRWGGGNRDPKSEPWHTKVGFHVGEALRTLRQMDTATGFLGSYAIDIYPGGYGRNHKYYRVAVRDSPPKAGDTGQGKSGHLGRPPTWFRGYSFGWDH